MATAMKVIKPMVFGALLILLPAPILSWIGFPAAAGFAGLAALAAGIATMFLGVRPAACLIVGMSISSAPILAVDSMWAAVALVMAAVAFAFGLSARWGWQSSMVLGPITLAFLASEGAQPTTLGAPNWLAMPLVILIFGFYGSALIHLVTRGSDAKPSVPLGTSRAVAYAAMLAVVTLVTTSIAVGGSWGHSGGWMIMTPFIVLQPYIQDGWRKSLRRAGGTVIGFVIVEVIGFLVPWTWLLYVIGALFAAMAMYAVMRKWDYLIYAAALTPAIIILEGASTSVETTAQQRLVATLIGVGLSLALMAMSIPFYRRNAKKFGITHY